MLARIKGAVALASYGVSYTCGVGDAVGDPVRISGNNTVTLALGTTAANAKVIGFIAHKGPRGAASVAGSTSCVVVHYYYKSGLSGLTAGNPVYLSNTGTISASAGTSAKILGEAISTTEAILYADGVNALYQSVLFSDSEGDPASVVTTTASDGTSVYAARRDHVHAITDLAVTNAKIANSTIDLTAKVTGILPSANGGTGNGFTKFSGPAAAEKTFTLPNASDTVACLGQAQIFTAFQQMSVGRKVKTVGQSVADSTTFANDNHLTFTLTAGKKYSFIGRLYTTCVATSGIKIDFNGGTATATSFAGNATFNNGATFVSGNLTALSSAPGQTAATILIDVSGSIDVNAGGTFRLRFAQNAETGAAETATLNLGSWMWVEEMP